MDGIDGGSSLRKEARRQRVLRTLGRSEGTRNQLSAFMACPTGVRFDTQTEQEEIVLLLRQHPVVNLGWIILVVIFLLIPGMWELLPFGMLPAKFLWAGAALWYLVVALFAMEKFLDWYFNVYIVTDERIIDMDFYGLVYKDMTVAQLNKVQDVNFKQLGGIAAMFDYGHVTIQTAGEEREFEFMSVPRPSKVVEVIYDLVQEEEQEELDGRIN